ncbi:hypothetical protein [Escherichia albertii]|uniref:hypothetical protein n=1 Tax=Escherichia albertii TaxID=208962 RepID=UPI00211A0D32|nr:hypothetical protein [Escherichia albertii]UUL17141.1 hypothetical protein NIZ13_13080 [Escherichia albertii]
MDIDFLKECLLIEVIGGIDKRFFSHGLVLSVMPGGSLNVDFFFGGVLHLIYMIWTINI